MPNFSGRGYRVDSATNPYGHSAQFSIPEQFLFYFLFKFWATQNFITIKTFWNTND
jgi:hypothetical protein